MTCRETTRFPTTARPNRYEEVIRSHIRGRNVAYFRVSGDDPRRVEKEPPALSFMVIDAREDVMAAHRWKRPGSVSQGIGLESTTQPSPLLLNVKEVEVSGNFRGGDCTVERGEANPGWVERNVLELTELSPGRAIGAVGACIGLPALNDA